MTPDLEPLLGGDELGEVDARLRAAVEPHRIVLGWATVELDRAQDEVGTALLGQGVPGAPVPEPAPDDEILGARCRLLRHALGDAEAAVLLEPLTEGRLAAALARRGEGGIARYLRVGSDAPDRAVRAGFSLSLPGGGPLGAQRLVLGGPRWGPFLLLVPE